MYNTRKTKHRRQIDQIVLVFSGIILLSTIIIAGVKLIFPSTNPTTMTNNTMSGYSSNATTAAETSGTTSANPTPAETEPVQLAINAKDLPGYIAPKANSNGSYSKTFAVDGGKITWWIYQNGNKLIKDYKSDSTIVFPSPSGFTDIEGVLTFRGNNYRDTTSWGTADIQQKKLEIVWTKDIGAISGTGSYWPGAGWTGQPLLVHWPEQTRQIMGINSEFKNTDLVEVIYPVFDGNIYFLDLLAGKATRDPIKVGYGFKGTGSVDPRGYPLFYAGQGLNDTNGKIGPFKYRIFDLIQNKEIFGIPGSDSVAFRTWGAFDPSAIIDKQSDTLIEPGENGVIYKTKLNTVYDPIAKTVTINPEVTKFAYKLSYHKWYGVESSPVMYRNLLYFSDNGGTVVCLDINTMEPVWMYNTHDDADATLVLEETADGVFLYHGNMVDQRCEGTSKTSELCNLRKFNALTGEVVWQYDISCIFDSNLHGGTLATPLVGKDDISNLVIFNVCKTKSGVAGNLIALDKNTGKPIWNRELSAYSWSSPISIKGEDGKTYGVFCDSAGDMHLFDPKTGLDMDVISLGKNVEASPSAYNNMIVVASYSQKIYGIKVK
jgi:outer membrane protein assembly factor BamB